MKQRVDIDGTARSCKAKDVLLKSSPPFFVTRATIWKRSVGSDSVIFRGSGTVDKVGII